MDRAREPPNPSKEVSALPAPSSPAVHERPSLLGIIRFYLRAPVTAALSAACLAIHILGWYWGKGSEAVLGLMGANHGALEGPDELHRLLAAVLLHGSWAHVLVNLAALMSLGPLFEMFLGSQRLLVLFTSCGLAGSVASALYNPDGYGVGASGALFGLFGAIVATDLRSTLKHGKPNYKLWGVLLFNVLLSLMPGIDGAAHLGGGVLGFAYGAVATPLIFDPVRLLPSARRRSSRWLTLAATACTVALAGCLALAVFEGRPWQLAAEADLASIPVSVTGLSLGLPELVSDDALVSGDAENGGIIYGLSSLSPLRVAVTFEHDADARGDVVAAMDARHRELKDKWLPTFSDGTLISQQRVELGLRPAIRRSERLENGDRMVRYDEYVGTYRVTLLFIRGRTDQRIWPDIEARIAASLSFEEP
jgi:membrane associated rhomboid family serine protease